MDKQSEIKESAEGRTWSFWKTIVLSVFVIVPANFFFQFAVMAVHILLKMIELGIYSPSHYLIKEYMRTFFNNSQMISESIIIPNVILIYLMYRLVNNKIEKAGEYFGLYKVKIGIFAAYLFLMAVLFFLSDLLSDKAAFSEPEFMRLMQDVIATDTYHNLFWLTLAVGVAAPVFEELLFRGFMYQGLIHSRAGLAGAVIIPALFWAVVHIQYEWIWVGIIFIMGIVFGLARHFSGSLFTIIAMHALNNFLSLIFII